MESSKKSPISNSKIMPYNNITPELDLVGHEILKQKQCVNSYIHLHSGSEVNLITSYRDKIGNLIKKYISKFGLLFGAL